MDVGGRRAERFDPAEGRWELLRDMLEPHISARAVVLDGRLCICGGSDDSMSGVEVFDEAAGRWRPLPPMREARVHAAAAVLRGCLFICGGIDAEGQPLGSAERFDPATGAWK